MHVSDVLRRLEELADPRSIAGKSRWNITAKKQMGITIPQLRRLAKGIGTDHTMALELWKTGLHEARILAGMIDDPAQVSPAQMDAWAGDFDSWDICDQTCGNLFDKTKYAYTKIDQYARDQREFVRRTAFTLMATLAVHDKRASNAVFVKFFSLIEKYAIDERNFVKKAVNWALRQIGKRNEALRVHAVEMAQNILTIDSPSARWIARDALRELQSKAVIVRLAKIVRS